MSERHTPAIAAGYNGRWNVYCLACSAEAENYVYPCRRPSDPRWPWPPAVLVAVVDPAAAVLLTCEESG